MNALKSYVTYHCINISALAEKADIPRTTLYNYMSGTADFWNMSVYTFMKLAKALGMTADELIQRLQEIEAEDGDGSTD